MDRLMAAVRRLGEATPTAHTSHAPIIHHVARYHLNPTCLTNAVVEVDSLPQNKTVVECIFRPKSSIDSGAIRPGRLPRFGAEARRQRCQSMRKTKEILRLYHEMGLSRRRIAESLQVAHSTVGDVIRRANGVGLGWPIPDTMTWVDVERLLYPGNTNKPRTRPMPEWEQIHRDLMNQKSVTLQLLWCEYKQQSRVEARSSFLKKQSRMEAFGYVLPMALLMATLLERRVHKNLEAEGTPIMIPGKRGTMRPTVRMILDMLDTVQVAYVEHEGVVRRV